MANCTDCLKYVKRKEKMTVVIMDKENTVDFLCDKCLEKMKERTKDQKVAVEITRDSSVLFCYRCGLKTKDNMLFLKHDCVKTNANLKFIKSLIEGKVKDG